MTAYFGETVTATAAGQTWRAEPCEHCGRQFYYQVQSTATGTATNPYFLDSSGSGPRAAERAQTLLDSTLRNGVAPVPCPHCLLYQGFMVEAVRANRFRALRSAERWLLGATPTLLFLGCFLPGLLHGADAPGVPIVLALTETLGPPGLSLLTALWVFSSRKHRQERYDPNAPEHTEARRQLAAAHALKPEEFAKLQLPLPPSVRGGPLAGRAQLVNQNCARCEQRIPDELDSRFCRGCGAPVHNRCAVPSGNEGCAVCGTPLTPGRS